MYSTTRCRLLLLSACLVLVSVDRGRSESASTLLSYEFANPQVVQIIGYSGDAMEPFLNRDGRYLFFNNSNDPRVNTNLHWATRIDDLRFQYKGEMQGVNTNALEGVPSMDRNGVFYFVSTRSYDQTASTTYRGTFVNGAVSGVELVPGVSIAKPGIVNFNAEISADGNTLYFVDSQFDHGQPKTAALLIARKKDSVFVRADDSASMMAQINRRGLDYAAATSASELELYFTRLEGGRPAIYMASRSSTSAPFGLPKRIAAITGFAEAPSLSPDEESLYFHQMENGRFGIYRVTRR
jgi:Tol biopolymer transport system component